MEKWDQMNTEFLGRNTVHEILNILINVNHHSVNNKFFFQVTVII